LVLAVASFALFGISLEQVGRSRDGARYPQIGSSFDIGGRSLNIYCVGEGGPVVVFDTFSHLTGYNWISVQAEVSKLTRACWYDRAGYGWSDPGPLYPTANHVASDLHALLTAAAVPRPYVFVGQGDVTLQVRAYHKRFPKDVAGAVFVNGNDVVDRPPPSMSHRSGFERVFGSWAAPALISTTCSAIPAIARLGLTRLGKPRRTWSYGLTADEQEEADFLSDNSTAYRHTATGLCVQEESRFQARAAGNLGDLPLRVLVSGSPFDLPTSASSENVALAKADLEYELQTHQPRLAALSTRGRVIVVEGEIGTADVVTNIVAVVNEVRSDPRARQPPRHPSRFER
jgi:pimeloyl-ACP methyl ester carboxylesterase